MRRRAHPGHGARGPRRDAATLLTWLPADLRGARLLDAGCGTGALAIEAAKRGAHVVATDISPALVGLARDRAASIEIAGRIEFVVGDMFDPALGRFDQVVAMDSLIHYRPEDTVDVLAGFCARTSGSLLFTFAPRTPLLTAMHAAGRFFPRGDRAPAIVPVTDAYLRRCIARHPALPGWRTGRDRRIASGLLYLPRPGALPAMNRVEARMARVWTRVGSHLLPFADVASTELPMARLLRLSLFQISCGMTAVLLIGTLNRVMIVELHVSAGLVASMLALPLVFAPLRALIGFKSDTHRSLLGWRRVPYLWFGTIVQFSGLAIMPFALIVLSGDTWAPPGSLRSRRRSPSCWWARGCTRSRRGPGAGDRSCAAEIAAERRGAAVPDAAGRHGASAVIFGCCWRISARSG
jgi:magnesium-protoporphyrin O-methyltransferase